MIDTSPLVSRRRGRCIWRNMAAPALGFACVTALWLVAATGRTLSAAEENAAAAEQRLRESVKFLASDEMEGRGIGTEGLDRAADYVADRFRELGLKTTVFDRGPFQQFTVSTESKMGPKDQNTLTLVGPPENSNGQPRRVELEFDKDFNPLAVGGSGQFDVPLVFVGYGITAKDEHYDDYAGIDVAGKAVLMLRKEPQQNNPHSAFNGNKPSSHAFFTRKIANAYEHGATVVIIVNDQFSQRQRSVGQQKAWQQAVDQLAKVRDAFTVKTNPAPQETAKYRNQVNDLASRIQSLGESLAGDLDEILAFQGAGGTSSHRKMPVFFASRASFAPMIESTFDGTDLAALETAIDADFSPRSRESAAWRAVGRASVLTQQVEVKNVLAVLEGSGPLANETVIVGAHYDHLGRGGSGSLAPWTREIHNGADDNASGTSALLEVARILVARERKPSRRIVFIAFTGEERGLLGSAHYVRQPRYPLERTVAMVNMDMVGRLKDNKLIVYGTGTAAEFSSLVDRFNEHYGFAITKKPGGFGPSDHDSFYAKKIPVLFTFTGTHNDYHRPSDDFEKINFVGMRRISRFVADIVASITEDEKRPQYREIQRRQVARGDGDRPYLGSIPDFSQQVEGYPLGGVAAGGPADRAGLQAGDVIIKFGTSKIGGLEDIDSALRKFNAGDQVPVVVLRKGKPRTFTVTLDPPR